jgi:hypothetical protein
LEQFAPASGHSTTVQIRRCRTCGTLYRYRYHSEYDVSGSWDEFFIWKLSPAAQIVIGQLLNQAPGSRSAGMVTALRNPAADLREDAALLLWILTDADEAIDPELLAAACESLTDATYLVGNYCYRALLSYAYRGALPATRLRAAILQTKVADRETRFAWILLKECQAIAPES